MLGKFGCNRGGYIVCKLISVVVDGLLSMFCCVKYLDNYVVGDFSGTLCTVDFLIELIKLKVF